MKKKYLLIVFALFLPFLSFSQSGEQKQVLDSLKDGPYRIDVFYFSPKKVGYEITKNKGRLTYEIIEPQQGSTLGLLQTKEQFKPELMKIAKSVLKVYKEQ